MKSVSPVKTALSSPSSNRKQMLSCVWQGVCRARTFMLSPIVKVELWDGVSVTLSQSLPPIIGSLKCLSWEISMLGFVKVYLM